MTDGQIFRSAVTETDNHMLEENGITAHPELDGSEWAIVIAHLNPVVIVNAVDWRVPQEVPNEALPAEGASEGSA
jgi:hypothetical protein